MSGEHISIQDGATTKVNFGPPVSAISSVKANGTGVNYRAYLMDEFGRTVMRAIGPDGKELVPSLIITDDQGKFVHRVELTENTYVSYGGGDYGAEQAPLTFSITWDVGAWGMISSVAVLK